MIVIGFKTTRTACGETDCVFLPGCCAFVDETFHKTTGLALKDIMGYYSVLFTVKTKKPTASYLK